MEDKLIYEAPTLMELVILPTIVRGGESVQEKMEEDEKESGNPEGGFE